MEPRLLDTLADAQGLTASAAALQKVGESSLFFPVSPSDAALVTPVEEAPPGGASTQLALLARRGLQPALIEWMMRWLATRPLERALFAWDALTGALLPEDNPDLLDRLASAAMPLASALPAPGERCLRLDDSTSARALVEAHAVAAVAELSDAELGARLADHDLGAVHELARRDPAFARALREEPARSSLRGFAEELLFARLHTLAAVYLDYLARELGDTIAAALACEAYLEAGAAARMPAALLPRDESELTDETADLVEYVEYRKELEAGQPFGAFAKREALSALRSATSTVGMRTRIAATEIAVRFRGTPEPLSWLDLVAASHPRWAYVARAGVLVAAKSGEAPLTRLGDYVQRFGNDIRVWTQAWTVAGAGAPWRQASCRLLAREAFALPYEPAVWRALACAVADEREFERIYAELDARLANQSRL